MRCSIAAIQTLAMHPHYGQRDGIMDEACDSNIREGLIAKQKAGR